eukprot:92508-Pyramimonas_sp.AAC.1
MVSWRKGQRLQHIRCASAKDHFPLQVPFYHTFVHQRHAKRVVKPNVEACNAMLLYGYQREAFITRVEDRLSQNKNQFEQWESEGNVDQINAGMMECINEVSVGMLKSTPGYTETKESNFSLSREVSSLLARRRAAKEDEANLNSISLDIARIRRQLKQKKHHMQNQLLENR